MISPRRNVVLRESSLIGERGGRGRGFVAELRDCRPPHSANLEHLARALYVVEGKLGPHLSLCSNAPCSAEAITPRMVVCEEAINTRHQQQPCKAQPTGNAHGRSRLLAGRQVLVLVGQRCKVQHKLMPALQVRICCRRRRCRCCCCCCRCCCPPPTRRARAVASGCGCSSAGGVRHLQKATAARRCRQRRVYRTARGGSGCGRSRRQRPAPAQAVAHSRRQHCNSRRGCCSCSLAQGRATGQHFLLLRIPVQGTMSSVVGTGKNNMVEGEGGEAKRKRLGEGFGLV